MKKNILLAFVLGLASAKIAAAVTAKDAKLARAAVLLSTMRDSKAAQTDKDELLMIVAGLVVEGK